MTLRSLFIQNPGTLLQRSKLKGILNDFYKNDSSLINPMLSAYDSKILDMFEKHGTLDSHQQIRFIKKLSSDWSIKDESAKKVIEIWVSCIDDEVMALYKLEKDKLKVEVVELSEIEEEISTDLSEVDFTYESIEGLLIPCGIGKSDHGFIIKGLVDYSRRTQNESIYAVIYNFLQRQTSIHEKKDLPLFIKNLKLSFDLDYKNVYRLTMILLSMIKHGYADNFSMPVKYDGSIEELKVAIGLINDYANKLCSLSGIEYRQLFINGTGNATQISLTKQSDVYVVDFEGTSQTRRSIWLATRILYQNILDNLPILESLLVEISSFTSFKPGQVKAIADISKSKNHTIHIMPTGSGKSLIFYMSSMLQPCPTFIVSPTNLLIRDQIINLEKFHRIDDVCYLDAEKNLDFTGFVPSNKLIYLTPETFQNDTLIKRFITLNNERKITAVVLDEIHCLSYWSHDFRPEYLMLSNQLDTFLDRTYFWGFTATANYTVVRDICDQLDIERSEVYSPLELKKTQLSYRFYEYKSQNEMLLKFNDLIAQSVKLNQRVLVFVKNQDAAQKLLSNMGENKNEADIFDPKDQTTYHFFAEKKTKILIASDDLGVGINLPDVNTIIHYGLPISKGEYVQEIGRAGRNGEKVFSYVISQSASSIPEYPELVYRDTSPDKINNILNEIKLPNDFSEAFRKILKDILSRDDMFSQLIEVKKSIESFKDRGYIECNIDKLQMYKRSLYVLFLFRYVHDWSISERNSNKIKFMVIIKPEEQNISSMKNKIRDYFYKLGEHRDSISKTSQAQTIEELLKIYINWYYEQFLYHHKEQFFDMISFISTHSTNDKAKQKDLDEEISERLSSYFSLSMLDVSEDEAKFTQLTLVNIIEFVTSPLESSTITNLERLLADKYAWKFDVAMFVYNLANTRIFESSRFRRILTNAQKIELNELFEILPILNQYLSIQTRFEMIKEVENFYADKDEFVTRVSKYYGVIEADKIYYGIIAQSVNKKIEEALKC